MRGATGREGTVTEPKVADWALEHPGANIALRADEWIGIDVDAYDGKPGAETLKALEAELGELPFTISSTSRGPDQPSRIWFYRVPSGLHFVTAFPGVEVIQRSHRYAVVAPSIHPSGSTYAWYGYEGEPLDDFPSLDDFEVLPDAWLNRLVVPDDNYPRGAEGFTGSVKEWLERAPKGEPGLFMSAKISEIPVQDFGHDTLVHLQASIVAQAAQGETGATQALTALQNAWLRGPYNTPEYQRDWEISLQGAIKKFGALPAQASEILKQNQGEIFSRVKAQGFLDRWVGFPEDSADLREHVAGIIETALSEGLSYLEAATLGWHSGIRQSATPETQDALLEDIWAQTAEVQNRLLDTPVKAAQIEPAKPAKADKPSGLSLMSDVERERFESLDWWGEEFMRVMRETHAVMSDEYYELARWVSLSLCFAHKAVIPSEEGYDITLNFYGVQVGGTKTGKSRSLKPITEIAKRFWLGVDNPDIGGDATRAALTQALIRRDGLPTLFRADEADATIANWSNNKGEFVGMKQAITDIYMGDVPPINRVTQKDISGIHAKAFLNVVLTGIDYKIADVIEPGDWETGFINRFVWAKGERKTRSREQKRFRVRRRGESGLHAARPLDKWYDQWASKFQKIASQTLLPAAGEQAVWIDMADDVVDRHTDLVERFEEIARRSNYEERLDPTFGRLEETILKCAALVAITKERKCIEMDDYLIALAQGEKWGENIMFMVEATDESPRTRKVNRIYDFIAKHPAGLRKTKYMQHKDFNTDHRYAQGILDELIAQGRAETLPQPDGIPIVRVVKA